jgi:hypothetical protein
MLRKLLIIFLGLTFSAVGFSADKSSSLHLEPEASSKIIGAINNTEAMILLESQGTWSKVIDVETGMVGWLKLNNSSTALGNTLAL